MSSTEIRIRRATLEDLPVLLDFEQGIVKAERPFDVTIREGKVNYYDLEKMVQDPKSCVIVAEVDGRIVSSGYAIPKQARHYLDHEFYAYLGFMYTDVDYRGRGINALIVEALKKWSQEQGFKEIRLTVYNDNVGAIKAYEKVGFKKHIIEMRLEQ
ncbi:GNAT family N-acetyltransferase [Flagellimonas aequoris]|uniref:GNAT family N-acetyltransferase n=1 Tax=Flagellimonas aequoris TaxID=2306997 RepID=A0A418N2V7_9FLAO|nr:GNAT family N-acetyltransferase [Allomuricauda aequoris]RIV67680.1 GNAT family N-acetyltransferase [Allomuricauda aequoris]TXJ99290.1 GNAT family N-acetyltransferase [Allomuricauda aequoris]